MARAKNTVSEEDLKKCLKGELGDPAKFNGDIEDVVDHYSIFIKSLLKLTPRPNVSVLTKAAQKVFVVKAEPDTCTKRAQSICNALLQKAQEYEEWDEALSSCESSPQPTRTKKGTAALPLQSTSKRSRVLQPSTSSPSSRSRILKPNFLDLFGELK